MNRQEKNGWVAIHDVSITTLDMIESIKSLFDFSHHLIWIDAATNQQVNQLTSHFVKPKNEAQHFLNLLYLLSGNAI